jgi:hypothetical protein
MLKLLILVALFILFVMVKAIVTAIASGGQVLLEGIQSASNAMNQNNNYLKQNQEQSNINNNLQPLEHGMEYRMTTSSTDASPSIETKLILYKSIASTLISKRAMNDERITNYSIKSINHGHSAEEAVINSYLFDVALQMEEAGHNLPAIISIYTSIMEPLGIFKQWKDDGKVSVNHWSSLVTLIHKVAYLSPGQSELQSAVLMHLNEPNDIPELIYDLQKTACRILINKALVSLDLKPINNEVTGSNFCIFSSSKIVKAIMQKANVNLKPIHDDDILTGGIFVFMASNHITLLMDEVFEFVSSICVLELLGRDRADCVQPIAKIYNNSFTTSPAGIQALGDNFVAWLNNPTDEGFNKIIELYMIFRKHLT